MKGNLFLKLKGQTNSKNKPKFLNVTFLNKFSICSRKNGGKWCVCFNRSYFTYFWHSLCGKLTKSLALHGFGKIFTHSVWFINPDTPRFWLAIFRKTEISWFFFLIQNPKKRSILWKISYYWKFKLWVRYQVWFY